MPTTKINVRIPQLLSIETAIRIYYQRIELSNNDIREIFGKLGSATIAKLKRKAREVMQENNRPVWNAQYINTEDAYTAWGLDIKDLERRWRKIRSMEPITNSILSPAQINLDGKETAT